MAEKDIVVVGASAGGMEALQKLVARLPADFPASLFVVWHMSPTTGHAFSREALKETS